jgi:hypothetical protein
MRLGHIGAALGLALLLVPARPAAAQSLASLAAASSATTTIQKAGCWDCENWGGWPLCRGGYPGGYWNCTASVLDTCQPSSPGCGIQGALPLDPDGSAQYVSRSSVNGIEVSVEDGGPPVRRNCNGVVVARRQSSDDIAAVRMRTGSLTL